MIISFWSVYPGEQTALAYDPQHLERLLVSRETLGMLTASRRHSEALISPVQPVPRPIHRLATFRRKCRALE